MEHVLKPKHEKLSPEEAKQVLEKLGIRVQELPKIRLKDKAIGDLDPQEGDIIKITRNSETAGVSYYYRGVISD